MVSISHLPHSATDCPCKTDTFLSTIRALVGLAIQKNKGTLTAEQLAPFLDRDELSVGTDDESFVLPALVRFEGTPIVDPQSNEIVYKFETMESTAGGFGRIEAVLSSAEMRGYSTGAAEEEQIAFSLATSSQRTMACALGVFNFVGVVALGFLCGDPTIGTCWAFPKSRHTVRPDYSDCLLIHITKYTHTRDSRLTLFLLSQRCGNRS